ncbi:MAG TPA: VWA domain-containing protein [Anaerolineales bacterium]|nr:VWA domain-containing protein [Anaerolineales bacterium]
MSLLWPGSLILLVLIPLAVAVYIWLLRRRQRFTIRFSSLSLMREAVARQSWLRRHLPFLLFLFAIASLVLALGRPVATVLVPTNRASIIMAIDVSRSMCSNDIPPNRLEAAKDAAQAFIQNHRSGRQIGLVAFAGFAELIQPPTEDVRALNAAVESLTEARRTAIGSAILRSLDAIAEVDDRVAPSDLSPSSTIQPAAPEEGFVPHIIVLLTDGASNAGPHPLIAAEQAVERGVRVYTIGFGTTNNNSVMDCGPFFQGENPFGGGFGFGGGFRRDIDEVTLKQIAEMTGGAYYTATSASELESVFQNLPTYLITTRETIEISVFFAAFAALMIVLAMIVSFLRHPLP